MELIETLSKYLNNEYPQALFIDVDGVMTVERGSYIIDLDLVKMLRELVAEGIPVILVSGNAYPVVLTLQRYLGLSPIFIAENGCVIQIDRDVQKLCRESLDPIANEIVNRFSLKPSMSNIYRLCDRAFHISKEIKYNAHAVRELEHKIMSLHPDIYAYYTGYVLHIYPRYCSKSIAINIVAQKLRVDLSRSIAIGDSVTDIDMVKAVRIGVATGDADEELKKEAEIVLSSKASESTKILIKSLIDYIKMLKNNKKQ
jgi:phosphoglycolate phosphatase (TIGR01487 family)